MSKKDIILRVKQYVKTTSKAKNIKKIALFGSYLNETQSKDSDVDILVEFCKPVSYFDLIDFEDDITEKVGKKIDLVTPNALSKFFRSDVITSAETIYESHPTSSGA